MSDNNAEAPALPTSEEVRPPANGNAHGNGEANEQRLQQIDMIQSIDHQTSNNNAVYNHAANGGALDNHALDGQIAAHQAAVETYSDHLRNMISIMRELMEDNSVAGTKVVLEEFAERLEDGLKRRRDLQFSLLKHDTCIKILECAMARLDRRSTLNREEWEQACEQENEEILLQFSQLALRQEAQR